MPSTVDAIRALARAAGGATLAALLACGSSSKTPSLSPSGSAPPPVTLAPQPDGWEGLPASPLSPGLSRHEDLTFIDQDDGWLVNARGEVHATHDGGATWTRLAVIAGVPLRCVGFASLSKGWAGNLNATAGHITPDAALWETLDGGASWTNISSRLTGAPVIGLCGMRVVSPNLIVAVGRWNGPAVFVKSVDGGRSWTSRSMEPLVHGLVDVFFFNEREGFAVGAQGDGTAEADQRAARAVVLATADGGDTWEVRYISAGTGQRCWKIQFVTDRVGFVTTEGPSAEGVVLKTVDGGATWRPMPVSAGRELQAVGFIDADRGWVASFDSLYSTTDGGATWKMLAFGRLVNRMRVVNDSLVYACGDRVYRWRR